MVDSVADIHNVQAMPVPAPAPSRRIWRQKANAALKVYTCINGRQ